MNAHTTEITSLAWVGDELLTTSKDKTARLGDTVFAGHLKAVTGAVALKNRVVTISQDCGVRFFDRTTGKLLVLGKGHTSCVTKITATKTGVVTESEDGSIRQWKLDGTPGKVARGKEIERAKPELKAKLAKGFTAIGNADGTVQLVKAKRTVVLGSHDDGVVALAASDDGKSLASAGADGSVRVWQWEAQWNSKASESAGPPTLEKVWSAKLRGAGSDSFWIGGELWVGLNGDLQQLDLATGKELAHISGTGEILHVGPRAVVFAGRDVATIVNRKTGKTELELPLEGARFYRAKTLALATKSFRVLDPEAKAIATLGPVKDKLSDTWNQRAFSPDGKLAAVAAESAPKAYIWAIASGKQLGAPTWSLDDDDDDGAHAIAFTHDSTCLVVGTTDAKIYVYDARTGKRLRELVAPKTAEARFGWAPIVVSPATDRVVGWGGDQHHAILFDTANGKPLATLLSDEPESGFAQRGISFSPDGKRLVIGHASRPNMGFYDAITGKRLSKHTVHRPGHAGLRFDWLDERRVLSSTHDQGDKSLRLWDAETGERIWANLGMGGKAIGEIVVSPTQRFIAVSVCDWECVRIIDAATGKTIADLEHPKGAYVRKPSFSEDEKYVVTTTNGGPANLWRLPI